MDGQLRVELTDLRGWADQVGRAGQHCGHLASYLATFVPDGDFGRLLSLITSDYEALTLRVSETLELDAASLVDTHAALRHVARRFAHTDARVAQDLGVGAAITDDGAVATGFHDRGPITPPWPTPCGVVLPEVSFGWAFDKVCELVEDAFGWDLRRAVSDVVSGDVGKASQQASAWEHTGAALSAVSDNLATGAAEVATTWEGRAAASSGEYAGTWVAALDSQSRATTQLASYLRDAVTQVVDVAQVLVDVVKELVYIVMAGWSFACVPIFGQVRAIERLRDLWRLVWDAKKVLAVFWEFLVFVRDGIITLIDGFSAASLPPAPTLPAAA